MVVKTVIRQVVCLLPFSSVQPVKARQRVSEQAYRVEAGQRHGWIVQATTLGPDGDHLPAASLLLCSEGGFLARQGGASFP